MTARNKFGLTKLLCRRMSYTLYVLRFTFYDGVMRLYCVRHGEARQNEERLMGEDDELSPRGIEQAEIIAKRCAAIAFDIIIASPFRRARQTAETIRRATKRDVVYSDLVRERRWPSLIVGKLVTDPLYREVRHILHQHNLSDPSWHHSDEENFLELRARAADAVHFLASRKEENILLVSHSAFLKAMIVWMMKGERATYQDYMDFYQFAHLTNTGITVLEQNNDAWKMMVWNDHIHLGAY